MFLPPEHDPDSFVREKGSQAFEKKISEARPLSEFLLDELKGRVDSGTAEGRSRLVHEAKPLLQKLSAPALRLQLLTALAEAAEMGREDAARIMDIRVARGHDPRPAPARGAARASQLPQRKREHKLLQCLLAKPALVAGLPQAMLDAGTFEGRMLIAVADFYRRSPQAQGGELIEHFKDSEFAAALAASQAALLETKFEGDHMEPEFHGAVAHWQREQTKSRLEALTAKAERTPAEQVEIRDLVAQLKDQSESSLKNAII